MSHGDHAARTDSIDDLGALLGTDRGAAGCWCMWFIVPVKKHHGAGSDGNRAGLHARVAADRHPMGMIAHRDGAPVGWCAVGPRSRYARAIATPTYRGRDPGEDDRVWLLPCLFVRREARGSGLGERLVRAALNLARDSGAAAIEAFPHSGPQRRGKDTQVGFERLFARCGLVPLRRPSATRVVMRLELG